jgi:hypothetical protein
MLRISTVDGPGTRCMIVEGKLVGPWAWELTTACQRAQADLGIRELIVDLRNLMAISSEGEEVLLQLLREGIRIHARGVFTKQIVRQLESTLGSPLQRRGTRSA